MGLIFTSSHELIFSKYFLLLGAE